MAPRLMKLSLKSILEAAEHPNYQYYRKIYSKLKSSLERYEKISEYLDFEGNGINQWIEDNGGNLDSDDLYNGHLFQYLEEITLLRLEPSYEKLYRKKKELENIEEELYKEKLEKIKKLEISTFKSLPDFVTAESQIIKNYNDHLRPIEAEHDRINLHIVKVENLAHIKAVRLIQKAEIFLKKMNKAIQELSELPLYEILETYLDRVDDYDGVFKQIGDINTASRITYMDQTSRGKFVQKELSRIYDENF